MYTPTVLFKRTKTSRDLCHWMFIHWHVTLRKCLSWLVWTCRLRLKENSNFSRGSFMTLDFLRFRKRTVYVNATSLYRSQNPPWKSLSKYVLKLKVFCSIINNKGMIFVWFWENSIIFPHTRLQNFWDFTCIFKEALWNDSGDTCDWQESVLFAK